MPPVTKGGRKASLTDRPLSGLFAIAKPSGPTSMELLDKLKPLLASSSLFYPTNAPAPFSSAAKKLKRPKPWEKALLEKCGRLPPKIGQGGTLDPLAEGVLGLLGSATSSYDCKDPVVLRAPFSQVTEVLLREKLPLFTGEVQQIPPLYSALRMDGKRLFEYAREGIPLPRPIEARDVTVHELRLVEWLPEDKHTYRVPDMEVSEEDKQVFERMRKIAGRDHAFDTMKPAVSDAVEANSTVNQPGAENAEPEPKEPASEDASADATASEHPAAFTLEMTVSSGTYVRSIIHDLGAACGSAAHVSSVAAGQLHTVVCF
ncbi:hypothetical protein CBS9595_002015 [Malassezia furfur]|nr:hypothetical protein CBS9595_002015 [Malassezia furfur]